MPAAADGHGCPARAPKAARAIRSLRPRAAPHRPTVRSSSDPFAQLAGKRPRTPGVRSARAAHDPFQVLREAGGPDPIDDGDENCVRPIPTVAHPSRVAEAATWDLGAIERTSDGQAGD